MTKGNASRDASRSSPRGKASNEGVVFDGFTLTTIETDEVTIRLRHGGSGPPLLLLHGFPQTHAMWSKIAPRLAEHYTVVCPDLRGYGGSSKPESSANHETYSKRAMARDQLEVMKKLGFEKFHVAGHDRGGRCAYRLALDSPAAVTQTRGTRHRADRRHFAARRLALRHGLLALVLSRAGTSTARAHDQRRSHRLPVPPRPGFLGLRGL